MSKEKKPGKGKKALKIIAIILLCIFCLALIGTIVNMVGNNGNMKFAKAFSKVEYENQLVPELDKNGDYFFTTDREFKVLQLTDVHLGGGWLAFEKDSRSMSAVAAMIYAEKPDLVIVTGDIAYPVPFQAGTFNNLNGAEMFANLMETLGVYWTLVYGNHDTEAYSRYTREDISKFYSKEEFAHCLFTAGPEDVDGYGNQLITVKNSKGFITNGFIMLDSHSYTDGDIFGIRWRYDNIHENQVEWYKKQVEKIEAENLVQKTVTNYTGELPKAETMLFFHIPLTEYRDAWQELADNGFKDTADAKYIEGIAGEKGGTVYCGIGEDDLFETILELGSTKAIFCGHDHFNNFTVNYKGVDLVYGYSVDYLAYIGIIKQGSQRGCTLITLKPDSTYEINKYNLYSSGRYELSDKMTEGIEMQFENVQYQNTAEE